MTKLPVVLALGFLLHAAQAQTIWRCGADGKSYSDTPCQNGRAVETAPPRPAADIDAARQVADREQELADRLRAERRQRERVGSVGISGIRDPLIEKSRAAQFKTPAAKKPQRLHRHPQLEDEDALPEAAPGSRRRPG
jgi:Domain of unknown function (DUF4124)